MCVHAHELCLLLAFSRGPSPLQRDDPAENVLLDAKNAVRVADFGLARFDPVSDSTMTQCGTPYYVSARGRCRTVAAGYLLSACFLH